MDVRGVQALLVLVAAGFLVMPAPVMAANTGTNVNAVTMQEDDSPPEGNESPEGNGNESLQLEDANEIHITSHLHNNGSATFVVDYRFSVNTENRSVEQWRALRNDVKKHPEQYIEAESADWNNVLLKGENVTGREMELSNFTVSTAESTAPVDVGHVKFTFQWSSFAHVELNQIEAGAALSGFALVDGTTLQITWPDSYSVSEVSPESTENREESVYWDGERTEFTDDQPRIVLVKSSEPADEPADSADDPSISWPVIAGALALLVVTGVVGWWLRRNRSAEPTINRPDSSGGGASGQEGPPPELLSNEERVLRLLQRRGGRIKQQEVVSELEWTEAKTSQVVSGLREDDAVEVFRIGRENVLTLPDEETEE